jgi:hypothetical protein
MQQQNAEYEQCLLDDIMASEEARLTSEEALLMQRIQEESIVELRSLCLCRLPPEPATGGWLFSFRFHLPDGVNCILKRRFDCGNHLQHVFDFVQSRDFIYSTDFTICTTLPRRVLPRDSLESLQDWFCAEGGKAALVVECCSASAAAR